MQTALSIFERIRVATPQSRVMRGDDARVSKAKLHGTRKQLHRLSIFIVAIRVPAVCVLAIASPKLAVAIVCVVAAILSGCAASQKPRARAFPWAAAKNARPLAPEKTSSDVSNQDLFADLGLAVPAPPSPVAGMPSGPQRPRVAVVPLETAAARRCRKRR